MYINTDGARFHFGEYSLNVNGYHVCIKERKTGRVVYQRSPNGSDWMDVSHTGLAEAIENLEQTLWNTVNQFGE